MKRIRRIVRWTGTIMTPILLALWIASGWWHAYGPVFPRTTLYLGAGRAYVLWNQTSSAVATPSTWSGIVRHDERFHWWFDGYQATYTMGGTAFMQTGVMIPIWFIAMLSGGTAAWLWWRDYEWARPGRCPKCRYPIGTSAVCSECGQRL